MFPDLRNNLKSRGSSLDKCSISYSTLKPSFPPRIPKTTSEPRSVISNDLSSFSFGAGAATEVGRFSRSFDGRQDLECEARLSLNLKLQGLVETDCSECCRTCEMGLYIASWHEFITKRFPNKSRKPREMLPRCHFGFLVAIVV